MKNRRIINLIIFFIVIIVITLFVYKKGINYKFDERILNSNWYCYNIENGEFEIFYISDNYINLTNFNSKIQNTNSFKFSKISSTFYLNNLEKNKIKIISIDDNQLIISIDGEVNYFFKNSNESLNYEFKSYYGKSISEYKNELIKNIDYLKINYNSFLSLYNEKDRFNLILCDQYSNSIDNILFLDLLQNWINNYSNLYYLNINELSEKEILNLEKLQLQNSILNFNHLYPYIITFENKKIINSFYVKCNGFDCSKFSEIEN